MIRISTLLSLVVLPAMVAAQQPLSAIDWLDQQSTVPTTQPSTVIPDEPPVTNSAVTPGVEVMPLGEVRADAVGLLPTATTGLPRSLWSSSDQNTLRNLLARLDSHPLPAIQALIYTLLLAEADPPRASGEQADFLRARVHALVGYGAVEPARALLERAGPDTPALFDTWLSLTLLSGDEDQPCARLRLKPSLSKDFGARVYCTARAGDWDTAALTYDTAVALGALQGAERILLAQYLDPEFIEASTIPEAPKTPRPLIFRLFEAAGAPLPTRSLPLAYAAADLRGTAGWRLELEAAERLARTGALPATRLLGLYTNQRPAASGGIWDRVKALQGFEKALFARSADDIDTTLPTAWAAMQSQSLEVPFAELFADPLNEVELPTSAARLAFHIGLLSSEYELIAATHKPETARARLLAGLAKGAPHPADAETPLEKAIVAGFDAGAASQEDQLLLDAGKLGEAILNAVLRFGQRGVGSEENVTSALATLRAVGLEDTARRAALQLLLLEPAQ